MKARSDSQPVKVLSGLSWLWCLLFGWLYYVAKGMWGWAVVSFFTANGLLIILPLMNSGIVRKHYLDKGWSDA